MRRNDRIELEREKTPLEKCMKKRKVKQCIECCRCAYCWGEVDHPYADKLIDLWLDVKRI